MKKPACFLALTLLFPAIVGAFPTWSAVGIGTHDVDWTGGGTGTLAVAGSFGGTTVTFFWCAPLAGADECFEVNAAACTFIARGTCDFFRGPGRLRLVVTGGAPSINAVAAGPTQASAAGFGGGTAIALDWDQDGVLNVFEFVAGTMAFDPNDDGVEVMRIQGNGVSVADGLVLNFPISPASTPPSGTQKASGWYDDTNEVVRFNDGTNDLVLTPRPGGELDSITYVIDATVPPDQVVHVSLFNSIGGSIDTVPHCYLTDDPGGIGESADTPAAITPGTNQFLTQIGTDLRHFFLASDALGVIDLTFNESGGPAGDSYRLACLVDGTKFVSGVIIPRP